jgi:hypothetical protein
MMKTTRLDVKVNMSGIQLPFCSIAMIGILLCSPTGRALAGAKEANLPPLVIAHWMPQLPLARFNHHAWSRDLPLIGPMQFRGDPVQQMREAKGYGIDVFAVCCSDSIDWNSHTWRRSLQAADQVEGFYVIPCLNNGLQDAETPHGPTGINRQAAIDWVKFAKGHRSALRVNDKLVIHAYNWGGTSGKAVRAFREKIKEATGEEVFLIIDVNGLWLNGVESTHDMSLYPEDAMRDLLSAIDMAYLFWGRWTPIVDKLVKQCEDEGVYFGGQHFPGYWRTVNEIWCPHNHTGTHRYCLDYSMKHGVPMLNLTTWNDYAEHTHVQPSANWGDTRASIVKFYSDLLKKKPMEESRFFVTSPSEARLGIPFTVEALSLQPGLEPCHVLVRLIDRSGSELARWEGATSSGQEAVALAEFTLDSYPEGRWLRAQVEFKPAAGEAVQLISAPINIWPDVDRGVIDRESFSLSDRSTAAGYDLSLSYFEDEPGQGRIGVNVSQKGWNFSPWAEVHLLYGGMVLKRILRNEPTEMPWPLKDKLLSFYGGSKTTHPRTLRGGFVTPRLITMDGTIVYGDPLWFGPRAGEKLEQTVSIPMTEMRDDMILDRSLYSNHLRVKNLEAVRLIEENGVPRGLWVSPEAGLQFREPNLMPTGSFRLEVSLLPEKLDQRQSLLSVVDGGAYGGHMLGLAILPDGKIELTRDNRVAVSTGGVVAGHWNKVAVNFDGKKVSFQIDGKDVGEQLLDSPSSATPMTPFYQAMRILPGRIITRKPTNIATSYTGGLADLSIISGSAPDKVTEAGPATELVRLRFEDGQENVVNNRGSLAGTLPLPAHKGLQDDLPAALPPSGKSLSPHHFAETARSTFELPPLFGGTISLWIKAEAPAGQYWLNILDIGKKKLSLSLNEKNLVLKMNDGTNGYSTSVAIPTDGQWIHYAFTFDRNFNASIVYINGKAEKTTLLTTNLAGGAMAIAAGRDIGSGNFTGRVADIRIYDRALTAKGITELSAKKQ